MRKNKSRKNKAILLGIAGLAIVTGAALLVYFMVLKPSFEQAVSSYIKAADQYETTVSLYEDARAKIEETNDKLLSGINKLQNLVLSEDKPYDENTLTNANEAINIGKIAMIEIPEVEKMDIKQAGEFSVLQIHTVKSIEAEIRDSEKSLQNIVAQLSVPDYSKELNAINVAYTALDKSIKQLKQVICPPESFVLERIMEIQDQAGMTDIIALTEDTDPENYIGKAGWYTSKVIFRHKEVKHFGLEDGFLTLAEVGNPAGGCVETYTSVEDAKRRDEELKSMEGTVRSPGAHEVCGTLVLRVSEDMKTSTQKKVMELMREAMLRLE